MAVILSNRRYEEIKKIVVDLFIRYGVTCVPIRGFELATKMGVKIVPYSALYRSKRHLLLKKSEDGFSTEKDPGEWYIHYNDERDYHRINYTIMHEVGHIALDHTEDSELAEKEVRFFAKYALAPPVLVHKFKLRGPQQIADTFEISKETAGYAWEYYEKWLKYKPSKYTEYEAALLKLFEAA